MPDQTSMTTRPAPGTGPEPGAGHGPEPAPESRPAGGRASLTLAIASLAVLLAAADTYVVVLALPDMMLGVGIGLDELQRATPIMSAFLLGYVATLPLIGRLADLRGSRPVLIGCLLLFAVGCMVTASATSLGVLIAGRAMQGVGGGGLVPATLALVAAVWPAERRGLPLGVVGAVQETGSVVGPLVGAAVLALSGWRAIFWANLAGAVALALVLRVTHSDPTGPTGSAGATGSAGPAGVARRRGGGLPDLALATLAVVLLEVYLEAPDALAQNLTLGYGWEPLDGVHAWTAPLPVATAVLLALAAARWGRRTAVGTLLVQVDALGSLLVAGALSCLVLAFATADPQVAVVAQDAPLLLGGAVVLVIGFGIRQRLAAHPLLPRGTLRAPAAWGSLVVNLLVGTGLVAALVDVPVFSRATTQQTQLGAAMVLVRLLVAVPVGALAGGWATRRLSARWVAATGMLLAAVGLGLMTRWDDSTLVGLGGTGPLVLAGLGFGLAIAPVNAALLAATHPDVHGVASALVVVARMVGMLAGLSVLTAVGLRVFYNAQRHIGTPIDLCPTSPSDCPAYTTATHTAELSELHAIFGGAAVCAAVAGLLCLLLLRLPRSGQQAVGTPAMGLTG